MSGLPPDDVPPVAGGEAFDGFDLQVMTDRSVYAPTQAVRITVTAANQGPRLVEHHYPGWQRYILSVRDEGHREVASDALDRPASSVAVDRWLPGQIAIWPSYWNQHQGPLVPAWADEPPGPPVGPGRYRIRVDWLGREPGSRMRLAEAWSPFFELT